MIHHTKIRPAGAAFTMVELMVVLVALTVLVAMVVGIGSVVADEQHRTQTRSTQSIIIAAVEHYHQIAGNYPIKLHWCSVKGIDGGGQEVYCHTPRWQDDISYGTEPYSNEYWRMMTMTYTLSGVPEVIDIYTRTESFVMDQRFAQTAAVGIFNDAYGRCMDWDRFGGFGNTPAIISSGPDGYFGHATELSNPPDIETSEKLLNRTFPDKEWTYKSFQLEAQEDNVRSDGRSRD